MQKRANEGGQSDTQISVCKSGTEKYLPPPPPPPREQEKKIFRAISGAIDPYSRYGNAAKTSKTISTITILWLVKAVFEKRAAAMEVDTLISSPCAPAETRR